MVAVAAELASNIFVYLVLASDLIGSLLASDVIDNRRARFELD
jgi:hypothetical protein